MTITLPMLFLSLGIGVLFVVIWGILVHIASNGTEFKSLFLGGLNPLQARYDRRTKPAIYLRNSFVTRKKLPSGHITSFKDGPIRKRRLLQHCNRQNDA